MFVHFKFLQVGLMIASKAGAYPFRLPRVATINECYPDWLIQTFDQFKILLSGTNTLA